MGHGAALAWRQPEEPVRRPRRQLSWRALLHGDAAARARDAIDAVARALRDPDPAWRVGASLANGDAGLAVFYAYLGDHDAAARFAERAIDAVAAAPMPASLHHGVAGVAWAIEHVTGRALELGDDDPCADVDVALLAACDGDDFDLMSGAIGVGVYALERLPRPAARTLAERVVARLAELADRAGGISWREPGGRAAWNLGLAHGVPGAIALCAACVRAGVAEATARELLDGAVPWLLARALPDGRFPDVVEHGAPLAPARLAWCYGDLSIASALVLAGEHAGRAAWTDAGLALARDASDRAGDATGVRDACVCHGAAGLGIMFARLATAADEPVLAAAAARWFEAALALRRTDDPVGGFAPFVIDRDLAIGDASVGLLTGAAGVALALLSAVTDNAPDWDRALLLSVR